MKIIDYINDKEIEVQIEKIGKAGAGYNAPTIVNLNGIKGYKKKSINCATFDSFEYLISELGKMLNIKTADTYILDDGSIFSKSVNNDEEVFITVGDLKNYIIVTDEEILEKKEFEESLNSFKTNNKDEKRYLAKTSVEIDYVINLFIRMIQKLNLENEEDIKRDYIRMCFLDSLTGNKDRVSGNFGLVKKKNKFTFAPLFDSSTISYPGVDDNLVQINKYFIDRNDLLNYVVNKYPHYINDILNVDMKNVKQSLGMLSSKVLNEKDREWFDSMVTNRIPTNLEQSNQYFLI